MNLLDLKKVGVKCIISKFLEPETRRDRCVALLYKFFVNANSTILLIFSIDHKRSRIFTNLDIYQLFDEFLAGSCLYSILFLLNLWIIGQERTHVHIYFV